MYFVLGRRSLKKGLALICCLAAFAVGASAIAPHVAAVSAQKKKLPIYSVEREEKVVALGINCAWSDEDVPKFLEILKAEDAVATFFVVGQWAEKYPESTRMLFDAGHEVQSHSYSHPDMAKLSREEIVAQVQKSEQAISQITGVKPTLLRPPSGSYSNTLIETLEELDYYCIQWDCDTIDWKNPTPDEMVNRVARKVRPGSILLLHVGAKNTPEALPKILRELKLQGYRFVKVSDLIYKENYTIDVQGRQISNIQ